MLLNMGGISYLDSSGLGALVAASVTTNSNGGELKLLHLTKRLHDLLSISKLLTVFETYDDEAEALRSFPTPASA